MEIDASREYAAAANSGRTRWEVTGQGGFAGLRVVLQKGAVVRAESDALIVKGPGVTLASEMGNLFQSMARSMLTNESFFLQRLGAELDDCEVLLGGPPGDIFLLQVGRGAEYMLTSGAYLASDEDVQIGSEMHSNPLQGLFAGTGLFIMRAGGTGTVAVTCAGSMVHYKLRGAATMSVDNGHLVAWTAGMKYWVGMATGSVMSSVASGEGLMVHFTGPGDVYIQTQKLEGGDGGARKSSRSKSSSGNDGGPCALCFLCFIVLFFIFVFGFLAFSVLQDSGFFGGGDRPVHQSWDD